MNYRTLIPFAILTAATGGNPALAGAGHDDEPAKADMHMEMTGGHAHDRWIEAPTEYRGMRLADWGDAEAARRGEAIYLLQCAACHGDDGLGDGPMAMRLEHPPADLTNNFHQPGIAGDDYLFWRVSEGGQAAPFKAAGSSMPAFKFALDEQQRWDVLTYLHRAFHTLGESHGEDGHEDSHG